MDVNPWNIDYVKNILEGYREWNVLQKYVSEHFSEMPSPKWSGHRKMIAPQRSSTYKRSFTQEHNYLVSSIDGSNFIQVGPA